MLLEITARVTAKINQRPAELFVGKVLVTGGLIRIRLSNSEESYWDPITQTNRTKLFMSKIAANSERNTAHIKP